MASSAFLFLVAAPDEFATRIGAKFRLDPGSSLLVGGSSKARIPVGAGGGGDVDIHFDAAQGLSVGRTPSAPSALLSGALLPAHVVPWPAGATLVVDGAWALAAQPPAPEVDRALELRLAGALDDPQVWGVYRDGLLERGSWVGRYLAEPPDDAERRSRALGAFAAPVALGRASVGWGPHGLVASVRLFRSGLVERPGLHWLLRVLTREPALRCVSSLTVEAFVGQHRDAPGVDAAAAELLDALTALPCAPFLRDVRVGSADLGSAQLTAAAERRLRAVATHLATPEGALLLLRPAAFVELVSQSQGRSVVGLLPGERRRVATGRTVIGTDGSGPHLRVVGPQSGRVLATLVDAGGQWTVATEGAPARLVLSGDEFEVEGLTFRFVLALDG